MRGHTASTSECGSTFEEVLVITEGLYDVHNLGKDAAAVHHSLMEDLSKENMVLLPRESVLTKDATVKTDAMTRERETKLEIFPTHGQAIYQSCCLRIREACPTLKPLVPLLTFSMKELYSMLTRLARIANLHVGNLHKTLEGLEARQTTTTGSKILEHESLEPQLKISCSTTDVEKVIFSRSSLPSRQF